MDDTRPPFKGKAVGEDCGALAAMVSKKSGGLVTPRHSMTSERCGKSPNRCFRRLAESSRVLCEHAFVTSQGSADATEEAACAAELQYVRAPRRFPGYRRSRTSAAARGRAP